MEILDETGIQARAFLQNIQKLKDAKKKEGQKDDVLVKDLIERKNLLDLNIVVGLDISGSISPQQFGQFMRQLRAIKGLSRVKVIEIDTKIQSFYDFSSIEHGRYNICRLKGGGGTDFTEAFEVIQEIKPDAVLFMTDGYVNGNPKRPSMPVGWILTHSGIRPYGFGEVVFKLP